MGRGPLLRLLYPVRAGRGSSADVRESSEPSADGGCIRRDQRRDGAYIVLYPRVRVHMLVFLVIFITRIVVPAYLMLGYWFLIQLVGGGLSGEEGGVAFWAHAGGFLAGALLIQFFRDPVLVAKHRALARMTVARMSPHPVEERARSILSRTPAAPAYTGVPPWLGRDAGSIRGIGRYVDHTLLKPEATREQVLKLCDEAARFGVKAVCVNGCWVETCVTRFRGSGVLVATVVGFPLGAMTSAAKAAEAQLALASGAREVDMVDSDRSRQIGRLGLCRTRHPNRCYGCRPWPGKGDSRNCRAGADPDRCRLFGSSGRRRRLRQDLDRVSPGGGATLRRFR